MRVSVGVAVVSLAVASCSSGSDDGVGATEPLPVSEMTTSTTIASETTTSSTSTTTTTTSTTTTSTTSTTTTTVSVEVLAGDQYLGLVLPFNCAHELYALAYTQQAGADGIYDWEYAAFSDAMRPSDEMMRDASLAMMEGLIAYGWPESVQGDVDDLVSELAGDAGAYDALASAQRFDDFLVIQFPEHSAATVVRAKLGLPSNINNDVAHCAEIFGG